MKFSVKTIDVIGNYVYILVDPLNDLPIYVGRGQANRIFDHRTSNPETNGALLKKLLNIEKFGYEVIRKIIRFGLTLDEAILLESSIIDLIGIENLCNSISGHNSIGFLSAETIENKYSGISLKESEINEKSIWINLRASKKTIRNFDFIETKTKLIASLPLKYEVPDYIFVVNKGLVIAVFDAIHFDVIQRNRGKIVYDTRIVSQIEYNDSLSKKYMGMLATDIFKVQSEKLRKFYNI